MAKMQVFEALSGSALEVIYFFDNQFLIQDGATAKRAIYVDQQNGQKMVVHGKGLDYSDNDIIEGTLSKIEFLDADNEKYATIDDLDADAVGYNQAYHATSNPSGLLDYLLRARDIVLGSNVADSLDGRAGKSVLQGFGGDDNLLGGDLKDKLDGGDGKDILLGGGGNDRLEGGAGSDTFHFFGVSGSDVIVDFDAKGGGDKQDYLELGDHGAFEAIRDGDDVILQFDNFDTIKILGAWKDFDAETDTV